MQELPPRWIFNGDDFGESDTINQAIIQCYRRGVLTSASLMVTGQAFERAVEMARACPGLEVGLHLVLVLGRSVLPHSEIPSLVDRAGHFSRRPTVAGIKYFFRPRCRADLRREIAAQIEKFLSTGLSMAHLDGHLLMHCHPTILNMILDLSRRYPVRRVRLPREELLWTLRLDRRRLATKLCLHSVYRLLYPYSRRRLDRYGIAYPDGVYGLLQSGDMNPSYVQGLLRKLPRDRCIEVYSHPDLDPASGKGNADFDALVSDAVKAFVAKAGRGGAFPPSSNRQQTEY